MQSPRTKEYATIRLALTQEQVMRLVHRELYLSNVPRRSEPREQCDSTLTSPKSAAAKLIFETSQRHKSFASIALLRI